MRGLVQPEKLVGYYGSTDGFVVAKWTICQGYFLYNDFVAR